MRKFAAVIAGGSGTRFWPKSSSKKPKQLLSLTGAKSQLLLTWERLNGIVDKKNRFIVCTQKLKTATLKHVKGAWILAEPEGRNTMAAVCWSAWAVAQKDPNAVLAVLPADAFIKDVPSFKKTLDRAFDVAQKENRIVCLGMKPTYGATAYGYIEQGRSLGDGAYEIQRFIEKPDSSRAQTLFQSDKNFWNAGIFVFSVRTFINEVRKLAPDFGQFFDQNIRSAKSLEKNYKRLPSVAVDVALMEKTSQGAVISGSFGWNDLGSWPALAEVLPPNSEAGIIRTPGGHLVIDSKNIIADFQSSKLLALIGVEDLIVVETDKTLLICHKNSAQDIKKLVGLLEKDKKRAKEFL